MSFVVDSTTFLNPLDLLAPHSCRGCGRLGAPLCDCCKNNIIATETHLKIRQNLTGQVFAVASRDSLVGQLTEEYKFHSVRTLKYPLAELLAAKLPNLSNPIIIPLPTSTKHIRERGFDHTLQLAKSLAKLRHCTVEKALLRAKNTTQVGTNRKTRLEQAEKAYILNPKFKADPKRTYILLDDILTTGASLEAAKKKLQQAGALNIAFLVLAVSGLEN